MCAQRFKYLRVTGYDRFTFDSKRLRHSGNDEDQADIGIAEYVPVAVGQIVTGTVWNQQFPIAVDMHEARRIALG